MGLLLKDGVKYLPYQYKDEAELEQMVIDHYEVIFGKNAVFFQKQKIIAHSGIGTIPDGFVLLVDERKWYIVEVELSTHSVYSHIVAQISKFSSAIKNLDARRKLTEAFYNEAKNDIQIRYKFEVEGIPELYKFLSDTLANDPEIIIVIDEQNKELDEVCNVLPFQKSILEFKTFYREGVEDAKVHIHFFDALKEYEREKSKNGEEKKNDNSRGGSKTLMDILDVATIVFDEGKSYNEAVKIVASRRKVDEHTIMDKCTRRIGLNTAEFKALLEDKEKLISFLKEKFLKDEDGKIIDERLKRANSEEAII